MAAPFTLVPKANKHNSNWQLDDIPNSHHINSLTSIRFHVQPAQHAARKSGYKSSVPIQNELQKYPYTIQRRQLGNCSSLTLVVNKMSACFHCFCFGFEVSDHRKYSRVFFLKKKSCVCKQGTPLEGIGQ